MIIIVRSILYNIFVVFWTLLVGGLFLPFLLFPKNNSFLNLAAKIWAKCLCKGLGYICNLKMEVRGVKNIPENSFIIASKHQSALEIIALVALIPSPKFILRRSLIFVPFIGIYALKMGMILIDRKGGAKTLRSMLAGTKESLDKGNNIIIFPEGTRTIPGSKPEYKPGISGIYQYCERNVLPVATNTGLFWKKNAFVKLPGTYVIEFLPIIKSGLDKNKFFKILVNDIENASNKLYHSHN